jgi:outer membrane protein assembly factor BamB
MFGQNPGRTGYTTATGDLHSDVRVDWTFTAPDGIFGSPAAADLDGDGYMEIVIPVEKREGAEADTLFVLRHDGPLLCSFESRCGIHISLSLADLDGNGVVDIVFGTNRGEVYALNGKDGSEIWSIDKGVSSFRSSPLIYDIDSDNNKEVIIGSDNSILYSIDGESGIVEWEYDSDGAITSSPALVDFAVGGSPEILFGTDNGTVYVLDMEGEFVDLVDLESPIIYSTPADMGNGFAIGTKDGKMHIISKGSKKSFNTGTSISGSPSYVDDYLVFGTSLEEIIHGVYAKNDENSIYCIDKKGTLRWSVATGGWSVFSSPALADIDRDGVIEVVVGSREGRLYVLNLRTGRTEWTYFDGTGIYASPIIADVDNDDNAEIVLGYRFSNQVRLLDSPDKPDLVVTDVNSSVDFPEQGENITITATVKNLGNKATGGNNTAVIYTRSPILDNPIGNESIGILEVGAEQTFVFNWTVSLPVGEVGVYVEADGLGEVNESNEVNNGKYLSFSNDLFFSKSSFPKDVPGDVENIKASVTATVKNKGRVDLEGVEVGLFMENGSDIVEIRLGDVDIVAGGEENVKFSVSLSSKDFKNRIFLSVDPNNNVDEVREDNNIVEGDIKTEAAETMVEEGGSTSSQPESNNNTIIMVILLAVVGVVLWKKAIKPKMDKAKAAKKGKKKVSKDEETEAQEYVKDMLRKSKEKKAGSGGTTPNAQEEPKEAPVEAPKETPGEAPKEAQPTEEPKSEEGENKEPTGYSSDMPDLSSK